MVDLLQLPPEIIEGIGYRLEPHQNRKLRLVCQQIRLSIEPLAFEILHLTTRDFPWLLQRLEVYASQATRVGRFVRGVVVCITTTGGYDEMTDAVGFRELFRRAIFSLRNVKAVSLNSKKEDHLWIRDVLPAYIQSIVMDHFRIDIAHGHTDFSAFKNVQNLRSFIFRSWPDTSTVDMHHASQIIQHSPRLTRLEISTSVWEANSHAPRLHDFFPPLGCDPLPLEHLTLDCVRILLDDVTIPHFRSLKSLQIHNNLITPDFGSTYTQIWDTLRQEVIHLLAIDVNLGIVEEGLVSYLMSYKGIKSLKLDSEHQWYDSKRADVVASHFFLEAVPTMCQSLERLIVNSHMLSGWCFSQENSEAIKSCKRLRELEVSIDADETAKSTQLFEEVSSELIFLEKRKTRGAVRWSDPLSGRR